VRAVVAGEAALMGILGGTLGLIAGAGLTVIVVMVRGVAGMGLTNVNLWTIMWNSVQPALITGIVGVIAAPFIAGAAAWIPARSVLRGTPIETLNVQR
jgi:ABC-type antimicrobial peptide transport system permease subunit